MGSSEYFLSRFCLPRDKSSEGLFEGLEECFLVVLIDSRCTTVGFNLFAVEVCSAYSCLCKLGKFGVLLWVLKIQSFANNSLVQCGLCVGKISRANFLYCVQGSRTEMQWKQACFLLSIKFHVFPSCGPFFPSLFSFFTSSYNFEVNRHEKVGQKRETANCNVEAKKIWFTGLFMPSFSLKNTNVQFF